MESLPKELLGSRCYVCDYSFENNEYIIKIHKSEGYEMRLHHDCYKQMIKKQDETIKKAINETSKSIVYEGVSV